MSNKETEIEFERLIKEHELLIFKVCRVYAYTDQDRQDLYQEIMLQLWSSFPRFERKSKFSTWLYRVAIYTAIAGFRKSKKFIRTTDAENLQHIAGDMNYDSSKDDQLSALYQAIGQLNEIEKAITLFYLDDKSYEEMEEILGINQGNLRVKMNRMKDKLRQIAKR